MPKRNKGYSLNWRKERGTWEINWFESGQRKRKSTGTSSRADAERQLAELILEESKPAVSRCDPVHRIIGDVLADYTIEKGPHVKGKSTMANCVDNLLTYWGEKPVSAVNEISCRAYQDFRNKKFRDRLKSKGREERDISNGIIARELTVLTAAINHDYRSGRLIHPVYVWKPLLPDTNVNEWINFEEQ